MFKISIYISVTWWGRMMGATAPTANNWQGHCLHQLKHNIMFIYYKKYFCPHVKRVQVTPMSVYTG